MIVCCISDLERQPSEQRRRRGELKEERQQGREFTGNSDLVNSGGGIVPLATCQPGMSTHLVDSGGGRAGKRERRGGCLLRKCQGEKIISINAMPRQDEDDLKHQFLHLPCRLLLTSSKAVRKLLRRNELHGWNQRALDQEAHDQRVVANIRCVQLYILPAPRSVKVFLHNFPQLILCRKKWGIAPALTVEFVAYYHDRWGITCQSKYLNVGRSQG